MADSQPQTINTIPFPNEFEQMIRQMKNTGFHSWGLVIYRCTYGDDALWEKYMDRLKQEMRQSLEQEDLLVLWQYLEFTIIQDPSLENATKNKVRSQFRKWVNDHSIERDGPRVDLAVGVHVSRFNFCLSVDKRCIDTLTAQAAWVAAGSDFQKCADEGMSWYVVCILIDLHCTAIGKGPGDQPEIEGCTRLYTGWMYMSLHTIVEQYDFVSQHGLLKFEYDDYFRPPLVYPAKFPSSSIQA